MDCLLREAQPPGDAGRAREAWGEKRQGAPAVPAFMARLKGKGRYGNGENELSFFPNLCGDLSFHFFLW